MRWIAIGVVGLSLACKGGDGESGKPSGGDSACKPMTGLCQRIPGDELGKLFEVSGIVATEEDHDHPGPPGPMDDCKYTTSPGPDGATPLDILLRYQCFNAGNAAVADYKMTHDTIAKLGQPLESLPDLGDEAYWTYSGSDKGIIQGHMRVRKGNVIVQLDCNGYHLGGKQVVPRVAKERSIEVITRMLAKVP